VTVLGVTVTAGTTAWLLKLASSAVRDMPAPRRDQVMYGWFFRTLQDTFDNPDRRNEVAE
jgi:hypothetical protein